MDRRTIEVEGWEVEMMGWMRLDGDGNRLR